MKNSSQKREQNEKKKEALNEYLEALKVVDYWTGKVRELNGAFIYRSPSSNTELPTKAIGNPTVSVSMEMETAEENEREEGVRITSKKLMGWANIDQLSALIEDFLGWMNNTKASNPN